MKERTRDWNSALGIEKKISQQLQEDTTIAASDAPEQQEASYQSTQVIELMRADVNMLAGVAIPSVFKYMFPKVLLAAWELLCKYETEATRFPQLALGIPRGFAKTTIVKLYVLYCILFTKKKFILIVGSNATLAENMLADVSDMLSENNIVKLFGNWKDGSEGVMRQDLKKFGFRGRNIILAAMGAGGSLRGLNIKNERPDVIIFDDIQTREDAESAVISDGLLRWMIGTAMKAKSPKGCVFIFCGNMYPGPNSILKKLKQNPSWIKFISGAILADGTSLWPEHRSIESLLDELDNDLAMGHPEIFFSEVLNDTDAGINTRTDLSKVTVWPWDVNEKPQGKAIIIDPATDKQNSDLVAIGYMEIYDGTPALRTIIEERLSPGNTILRALLLALETGTHLIAVESTAYQHSLLYWFGEKTKELGIQGMNFVDIYSGSFSKNSRIKEMLKGLTQGEIVIHGSIKSQVLNQIANWNPMKRDNQDNILDLLAYMPVTVALHGHLMSTDIDIEVMDAMAESATADNLHMF